VRRMSVDLLRVHLQRVGERLGRSLDKRLADVLVSGDSSGATAPTVINTATQNAWAYADLVRAFLVLSQQNNFTPTHMLAGSNAIMAILNLAEIKDAALFEFAKSGNFPTPLGVKLIPCADVPADQIVMMDANFAVEKITEQDLLVESEKLISQQWDRTFLSVVTDFAVVYENARIVMTADW